MTTPRHGRVRRALRWRLVLCALAAVAGGALVVASCGGDCRVRLSGGLVVGCGEAPPGPDDAAWGRIAVFVEDAQTRDRLWIGIRRANTCDDFNRLRSEGRLRWIGGVVVIASDRTAGFFFAPTTTVVAAAAGASVQTTIAAIESDPELFAAPAGAPGPVWLVPANVLAVERLTDDDECQLAAD